MSISFSPKAGLIPYIVDSDGQLKMLFMVASDPKFGGPKPMISKGTIEEDETPEHAAIREAAEELGLKPENIKGELIKVFEGKVTLRTSNYDMTIYGVEVHNKTNFDKWDWETLYATWLTQKRFDEIGRRDHKPHVLRLTELINEL
jgi:8-oxo-dGTP pyrophosphatase MutT (NUDIX family)